MNSGSILLKAHQMCRFSFGSNGIYVGGKDLVLSELAGGFQLSGGPTQSLKGNRKVAKLTFTLGGAPSVPR